METTRSADPTRTGAVWVTATGSFLLFAAAVTLVAVRWDHIPDGMKLGALALLSGGLLIAGRPGSALADRHAPAAADVLFHLGAFLTPVTAAAVLIHLEVSRDVQLTALGAASAALFWVLGRVERSVVLEWATYGATVATTVGLGGLTPVPASAWLVALAAGAFAARLHPPAIAWSTLATALPLAAVLVDNADPGSLRGSWIVASAVGSGLTPGIVGLAAAVVLVGLTHRLQSLALLAMAATALISGLATTGARLDPDGATVWLAAAAGFALLELAALRLREDTFWQGPLDGLACTAEAFALLAAPFGLLGVLVLPLAEALDPDGAAAQPMFGAAFALATVGWVLADLRRQEGAGAPGLHLLVGGGYATGNTAAVLSALGAVAVGTGSIPLTAVTAGGLAVALVVSGRTGSPVIVPGLVLLTIGLLDLWSDTGSFGAGDRMTAAFAVGGSLLVAFQATLHRRRIALRLALASLLPAGAAIAVIARSTDPAGAFVAGLLLAAALSAVLDQARSGNDLGWVPRLAGTVLLVGLVDHDAGTVAVVTGTYLVLATFEAFRRDDPWPLLGWAVGLPPLVGAAAVLSGLSLPESAIVLAAMAVPVAAAGHRWAVVRLPLLATALTLAVSGMGLAATEPRALGTVLLLDGAVAMALALLTDKPALLAGGGVLAVVGTWVHLAVGGVEAVDTYALPVAVVLWLVATRVADATVSSWVTHAPAVALAGGTALAERIGGGPGEHALLAGAVGVLAVVEGGGRRLAAPLLLGTGLLVALTANETAVVTAGVPTWAWLAAGGALLVGAGLVMEHHQLGPVETGRRLVDVVQERFN